MRKALKIFIETLYALLFAYTLLSCFEWRYQHNVGSVEFYSLELFMGGVLVLTAAFRLLFKARVKDNFFFVTAFLYIGLTIYTILGMVLQSENFAFSPVAAFYAPMTLLRYAQALICRLLDKNEDVKKAAGRKILVVVFFSLLRAAFIVPFACLFILSGAVEIVLSLHIVYISAAICAAEILLASLDCFKALKGPKN